jgi:hypothetical protein
VGQFYALRLPLGGSIFRAHFQQSGMGLGGGTRQVMPGAGGMSVMPPNFGYPFYQPPSLLTPSSSGGISMCSLATCQSDVNAARAIRHDPCRLHPPTALGRDWRKPGALAAYPASRCWHFSARGRQRKGQAPPGSSATLVESQACSQPRTVPLLSG